MRVRSCKSGAAAVVVAAAESTAVAASIVAARFVPAACIVAGPRIAVVPRIAGARSFEEAWWASALVLLAIMAVAVLIAIRTTNIAAATKWRRNRGCAVVTSGAACRDGAAVRRRTGNASAVP
jgi:hypothetical protein